MIPILFKWDTTDFTTNGIGRLSDCLSCTVHEELNGIYEADFSYPRIGAHFEDITLGSIVYITHDDTQTPQPFIVTSYKRGARGVIDYHAVHISYRLLNVVTTVKGTYNNLTAALAAITAQSAPKDLAGFTITNPSNWWNPNGYFSAANGVPKSVKQILGGMEGSIIDTYGGFLEWDHFRVYDRVFRGGHKDFVLRQGVNITEYTEEADIAEAHYGVCAYWTQENNGARSTMTAWAYNGGLKGQSADIPRHSYRAVDVTDKFESKPTQAQLQAYANKLVAMPEQSYSTYRDLISTPKRSLTIDFYDPASDIAGPYYSNNHTIVLGDQVDMIYPEYNTAGYYLVVSLEYDVLADRTKKVELQTKKIGLAEALGV